MQIFVQIDIHWQSATDSLDAQSKHVYTANSSDRFQQKIVENSAMVQLQ